MRKILSFGVLASILVTIVSPTFALMARSEEKMAMPVSPQSSRQIEYPVWEDFSKLKNLIEGNFSPSEKNNYKSNCIANRTLCANFKYTSVIEKAIKLIILKTYTGNEEFYNTLFGNAQSYGDITSKKTLKNIIDMIPHGSSLADWKSLGFGNSIGGELLDASFGVNFTENANSSTMLGAIEQKIKDMKRSKCQKENSGNDSYKICPWNGDISNMYLPTQEELYAETIYLNRGSVKIGNLKDEIEYGITGIIPTSRTYNIPSYPNAAELDWLLEQLRTFEWIWYVMIQGTMMKTEEWYMDSNKKMHTKFISWTSTRIASDAPYRYWDYVINTIRDPGVQSKTVKDVQRYDIWVSIDTNYGTDLQGNQITPDWGYLQVYNRFRNLLKQEIQYYVDELKKEDTDQWKNITYTLRYKKDSYSLEEARVELEKNDKKTEVIKKDYKAMMSGAVAPEIPAIFAHVPSDSMVLYVRNPANLMDIMNQKSNTSNRLSGIDVSESIRNFMKTFFELEKFEQIEKHLKHDMAIVVNNLDATAPDIVIIISETDREALSPTGRARVVGSKDGFIFIASSKESLEKLTSLSVEKSLKSAPDFYYVWWKKSALVKDALMFVGDEFFAKMLTLETYLTHYRKYRDYARLTSLQELTWAYGDAFGKSPTGFGEFTSVGLSTLTGEVLGEYSIIDGLVTHRNIGTLNSLKTLPEARYDLSKISRMELEDYKYNVLQYRDIWRASLDPMGIVINRYGDGMEIDFFMTPIPSTLNIWSYMQRSLMAFEAAKSDTSSKEATEKIYRSIFKDSLEFVTNPHIRMGLASFVWGFDAKEVQKQIKENQSFQLYSQMFAKEVLDGKDIFDYLAWEFAFSIGNLDPDMLDGWNIEKIDIYGSVQVTSEEKWKELVDIIRTRILKEMGNERGEEVEMIKGFLAKPLIEDYNGKKIYYVEWLPIPFVGKIGFAYTFVDDFFIIAPNRSTIKNIIDIAKTWDIKKSKILSVNTFDKWTFFVTLFDGVSTSEKLRWLYEKNKSSIPRYMKYLDMADIWNDSSIDYLMGSYYSTQDRNKRLWIETKPFSYSVWTLTITGDTEKLTVRIDKNSTKSLSGITLQMWNNIESESTFPKDIMSEKWIPLAEFLALPNIWDIISLNIMAHLDSALGGTESLLRNVTFGMNMGDDEIGFRLRVFRHADGSKWITTMGVSSDMLMIGSIIVVLIILGGGVAYFIIRRKSGIPTVVVPPMPNTDQIITESPVIVSSVILPQDIPPVIVSVSESPIIVSPIVPIDMITPAPVIQVTVADSTDMPIESVIIQTDGVASPIVESTPSVQDITPESK